MCTRHTRHGRVGWGELDAERQQQATDSSLLSPSFVYLFLSSSNGAKRRRRRPDYFRLCSTLLRALALFDKQAKGLRRLLFLQNKNISLLSFPLFDFCSSTFYRSACLSSSAAAATAFLSVASRVFSLRNNPDKERSRHNLRLAIIAADSFLAFSFLGFGNKPSLGTKQQQQRAVLVFLVATLITARSKSERQ